MKIKAIKTNILTQGDDIIKFIFKFVPTIKEGSIIVLSSKVCALSQDRVEKYKNETQLNKIIKRESDKYLKTALCYLTIKDDMVMTNAGVDKSNSNSKIILLPKDPYNLAANICKALKVKYKISKLGIIISDSMIVPLRAGVIAGAIGYYGFDGVKNCIGKKDIYGNKLKMTKVNIVDSLCSSASLLMGECNEKKPIAIISDLEDAAIKFNNRINKKQIKYPIKNDLYYPLLKAKKLI